MQPIYRFPPPLVPGDRLVVVAPSGALREDGACQRGVEIWRDRGYEVELAPFWDARTGYLAGSDTERRQALAKAWFDPDCKAILCLRGGYGSMRLLEDWDWQGAPKWVVGFSDITALLWSLASRGIGSIHACVITTLAREPQWSRQRLFDAMEGRPLEPLSGRGWGGGKASGVLLPANLALATHLLGTPLQLNLAGAILAIEDISEIPYRVDRMLTQWRLSGALTGIRGIALGRFSRCQAPLASSSWTVEEVLRDRLEDLGVPIICDLPFGHDGVNAALPVGSWVELDGDGGTLSWL